MSLVSALAAGGLVGLASGVLLQRSHFCTMGALSDVFLFGSTRRLRQWAVAALTSLVLVQLGLLLAPEGLAEASATPRRELPLLPLLPVAVAFGFGMVLAGGCPSRNLVRLGQGHLGAGWALLLLAGTAGLSATLLERIERASLGPMLGTAPVTSGGWLAGLLVALGLLGLFALMRGPEAGRDRVGLCLALALGAVAGAALVASGLVLPTPLAANLVAPWIVLGAGGPLPTIAFTLAIVIGIVLGAAGAARASGQWRRAGFRDRDDAARTLLGGALMGTSAGLIGGCTLAHGLGGLALLAPASFLALPGMALGARWALRYLETGQLFALGRRSP